MSSETSAAASTHITPEDDDDNGYAWRGPAASDEQQRLISELEGDGPHTEGNTTDLLALIGPALLTGCAIESLILYNRFPTCCGNRGRTVGGFDKHAQTWHK